MKGFHFLYQIIYAFSKPSWSIAHGHGVCTQSVPASTLALARHAHTQWYCLLLLGQRDGGLRVLRFISLIPLND